MGSVIDRFALVGVQLGLASDGRISAVGPLTDELRAEIRQSKPAILAELTPQPAHRTWGVTIPEREPFQVIVVPHATQQEMQDLYPTGRVEPVLETPRPPTEAEAAEIRQLVPAVCAAIDEPDVDLAVERALADAEDALTGYRALVREYSVVTDTRRSGP